MRALMARVTLLALLPIMSQAGTEVYTWVDEDGQVHYSDTWAEGCEKVEIPEFREPDTPAMLPAPPISDAPAATTADAEAVSEEPEAPAYMSLTVISPTEDECLRRIGGIVKVVVEVDPPPQKRLLLQEPGHRLLVDIDGERMESEFLIAKQDNSLALYLTEVFRGTHRLRVTIEDEGGTTLAHSQTVNFHVQQISQTIRQQQRLPPPLPPPNP